MAVVKKLEEIVKSGSLSIYIMVCILPMSIGVLTLKYFYDDVFRPRSYMTIGDDRYLVQPRPDDKIVLYLHDPPSSTRLIDNNGDCTLDSVTSVTGGPRILAFVKRTKGDLNLWEDSYYKGICKGAKIVYPYGGMDIYKRKAL